MHQLATSTNEPQYEEIPGQDGFEFSVQTETFRLCVVRDADCIRILEKTADSAPRECGRLNRLLGGQWLVDEGTNSILVALVAPMIQKRWGPVFSISGADGKDAISHESHERLLTLQRMLRRAEPVAQRDGLHLFALEHEGSDRFLEVDTRSMPYRDRMLRGSAELESAGWDPAWCGDPTQA